MNFWNIFYSLCSKVGKAPNTVAKELEISSASITWWKHGERNPSQRTLKKIADYFGVSVNYLLGYEDIKKAPSDKANLTEGEAVLLKAYNNLSDESKKSLIELIGAFESVNTDTQRFLLDAIRFSLNQK